MAMRLDGVSDLRSGWARVLGCGGVLGDRRGDTRGATRYSVTRRFGVARRLDVWAPEADDGRRSGASRVLVPSEARRRLSVAGVARRSGAVDVAVRRLGAARPPRPPRRPAAATEDARRGWARTGTARCRVARANVPTRVCRRSRYPMPAAVRLRNV